MTFGHTHKQIVKPLSQTCNHIWRAQACATRKSAGVCVRWGVICASPVAFMAVATVWTRSCRKEPKKLTSAQDYAWNPDSGELDNNWDLFALTSPYKSPCTGLCVTLALSELSLIPPFFILPSLSVPFLPLMVPRWRAPPRWAFCPCWGWIWREIRLPTEIQPFEMMLDWWIQHVSLPCPQMHWAVFRCSSSCIHGFGMSCLPCMDYVHFSSLLTGLLQSARVTSRVVLTSCRPPKCSGFFFFVARSIRHFSRQYRGGRAVLAVHLTTWVKSQSRGYGTTTPLPPLNAFSSEHCRASASLLPIPVFSILCGFTNFRPYFWPYMVLSGSCLDLSASPWTTHVLVVVFLSAEWVLWILSKNLTNVCSNRHSSSRQSSLVTHPEQYV